MDYRSEVNIKLRDILVRSYMNFITVRFSMTFMLYNTATKKYQFL